MGMDKNIFINEDFSQKIMELRKDIWEKVKKDHRDKAKIAYVYYRTVAVKRRNNQGSSWLSLSK